MEYISSTLLIQQRQIKFLNIKLCGWPMCSFKQKADINNETVRKVNKIVMVDGSLGLDRWLQVTPTS